MYAYAHWCTLFGQLLLTCPYCAVPRVLDCGFCLVGGVKFVEFLCQNVGLSAGNFCIVPKNQWPASNLRVKKIYVTFFLFCYHENVTFTFLHFSFLYTAFGKNVLFRAASLCN